MEESSTEEYIGLWSTEFLLVEAKYSFSAPLYNDKKKKIKHSDSRDIFNILSLKVEVYIS